MFEIGHCSYNYYGGNGVHHLSPLLASNLGAKNMELVCNGYRVRRLFTWVGYMHVII